MIIRNLQQHIRDGFNQLRSGSGHKTKAAQGSVWLGGGSIAVHGMRFLRNMILVRLLAPEAFGVMAIVLAINQTFETLTEIGIQTAIIQNPNGRERTYLNGAWWLAMARSVVLYTAAFLAAPWIAQLYGNPELVPLMRIVFLGILFKGAMSSRVHVAVKEMNYRPWVIAQHGGGLFGIVATILLSLVIRNVWALVFGFVIEAIVRCLLSYLVCPFRPGLRFDKTHWQALFKYTRGIAGLPILTFIFMRADIFVIGKFFSTAELGLYSMAAAISHIPFQLVGGILAPIMMPIFSEIQGNKNKINAYILKITRITTLLGFPILMFLALYGSQVLSLVYGIEYAKVAVPFAIIFATSLLQVICVPVVTYYLAIGRPELHRFYAIVRTLLIMILIYPAVKYFGLVGAAAAGFVAMASGSLLQAIRLRSLTQFDLRRYGIILCQALAVSAVVAALWFVTQGFFESQLGLNLLPGAIGCLMAYSLAAWLVLSHSNIMRRKEAADVLD
ncbi:MAG: oligosaccharide flippase family protein [bacterium]